MAKSTGGGGNGGRSGGGAGGPSAENLESFEKYTGRNNFGDDGLDNYRIMPRLSDRYHVAMRVDENKNIISHRVISKKARINDENAIYAPYGTKKGETKENMRKALYG